MWKASPISRTNQITGFTLVEMAVVVFIGAILLTAGLSLAKTRLEAAQIDVTQKHQETIKQALISYLIRNKRLPCPDIKDGTGAPHTRDGREDRNVSGPFGCSTPTVGSTYVGGVPYVDLGLERSTALDGWENYLTYIISPNWQFSYASVAPTATTTNVPPVVGVYNAIAAYIPKVTMGAIGVYGASTPPLILNACETSQSGLPRTLEMSSFGMK